MLGKIGNYEFMAEPFHCDFSNRLFMGHLGNHLLNAADFHSNDRGFGMNYLNTIKKTWVLSRLAIEMEEMPLSYTRFHVETWVESAMRFFTNRNFCVYSDEAEGKKIYGYGRSVWAVIDTETDSTVLVMETGPLPKMVCTSHDGRWLAVTHWGDNTVGLVDITSDRPQDWHYVQCFIVDEQLKLDFGLDEQVNRDDDSGWCLRGTVFTPDDRYLLVACMGRGGGIAVIDMKTRQYLGRLQGMRANVRHLVIRDGWLYLSINRTGYVQRIRLDRFLAAAQRMQNHLGAVSGWQECKVGNGARTIELSPDGRYVFAACHLDSRIDIVDTQSMKLVLSVAADSYPVGLDVSRDGTTLITTSQGRGTRGGNCVDIYIVSKKNK